MGENGRGTSSQMVQFDNPLDKMNGSQEADSEGIFDPEQPPSPAATAERTGHTGKTSKKPKKFPSIDLGSGDIENSVASGISASLGKVGRRTTVDENAMPTPDPKVTKAMLRAAFDKMAKDKAYKDEAKKRKLRVIHTPGAEVQKFINEAIDNANPQVVAAASKMIFGTK